ncbi:MAG: hypothetical protein AAFR55_07615 [Pseudomonadota bacterium]
MTRSIRWCVSTSLLAVAVLGVGCVSAQASESRAVGDERPPFDTRSVPTINLKSPTETGTASGPSKTKKKKTTTTSKADAKKKKKSGSSSGMTMATFLDRLMLAESAGIDTAKNPRSTATGPFQFIESTWLDIMRRHFPRRVADLDRTAILALRTDRKTARAAAEAFTRDNAAILAADGHAPTFPNLRLAFLLGAGGASRVLGMEPEARIAAILGPAVIRANPFLARMTADQLLRRSARDLSVAYTTRAGIKGNRRRLRKRGKPRPRLRVPCDLRRPSCKRWVAIKRRQLKSTDKRVRRAALKFVR